MASSSYQAISVWLRRFTMETRWLKMCIVSIFKGWVFGSVLCWKPPGQSQWAWWQMASDWQPSRSPTWCPIISHAPTHLYSYTRCMTHVSKMSRKPSQRSRCATPRRWQCTTAITSWETACKSAELSLHVSPQTSHKLPVWNRVHFEKLHGYTLICLFVQFNSPIPKLQI